MSRSVKGISDFDCALHVLHRFSKAEGFHLNMLQARPAPASSIRPIKSLVDVHVPHRRPLVAGADQTTSYRDMTLRTDKRRCEDLSVCCAKFVRSREVTNPIVALQEVALPHEKS